MVSEISSTLTTKGDDGDDKGVSNDDDDRSRSTLWPLFERVRAAAETAPEGNLENMWRAGK